MNSKPKCNKVLIWTVGLDEFLRGEAKFNGGIAVQLTLWAMTFLKNGWEVSSFSRHNNSYFRGIKFYRYREKSGLIAAFSDFIMPLIYLFKMRPEVVVFRGASRNLLFVSAWSKIFGVITIYMGANDNDFVPGKEIINYAHDRFLYRAGLRIVNKIIFQNEAQEKNLIQYYKKADGVLIPNIWSSDLIDSYPNSGCKADGEYVLWVANFHIGKRPHMFIEMAKRMPSFHFLMIGGDNNQSLYEDCRGKAYSVINLDFLGGLPFLQANSYFRRAKVFICTSESEGFPNTFLQAWANNVPVVTTVDPGGVIRKNGLGLVVEDIDSLTSATLSLLNDNRSYESIVRNIEKYFKSTHDSNRAFNRLVEKSSI